MHSKCARNKNALGVKIHSRFKVSTLGVKIHSQYSVCEVIHKSPAGHPICAELELPIDVHAAKDARVDPRHALAREAR